MTTGTPADEARAGLTAPAPHGRFIAGDPLRAIAALSVVLYHMAFYAGFLRGTTGFDFEAHYPELLGVVLESLNVGLHVFFVLSGYLIARPFIRAFVAGERQPRLRPYLRNRLLRIVPAFWAIFTILLIHHGALGSSPADVLAVYGLVQGYHSGDVAVLVGPAWTLGVEMGFYLLVPLVGLLFTVLLRDRVDARDRLIVVVVFATSVAAASLTIRALPGVNVQTLPPSLFAFVPGILLAAVEIRAEGRLAGRAVARRVALALAALGLLLVVIYATLPERDLVVRGIVAACGAGALVAAPLVRQWSTRSCWRVLDNRPLHWVGQRSYSIYLIHQGMLLDFGGVARAPARVSAAFALLVVTAGPLLLLLSHISHRLFEVPFLRRRERWRGPSSGASGSTRAAEALSRPAP